jgi:hypothetical protein
MGLHFGNKRGNIFIKLHNQREYALIRRTAREVLWSKLRRGTFPRVTFMIDSNDSLSKVSLENDEMSARRMEADCPGANAQRTLPFTQWDTKKGSGLNAAKSSLFIGHANPNEISPIQWSGAIWESIRFMQSR